MNTDIPIIHASRFGGSTRSIVLELLGYQVDAPQEWLKKAFEEGNKHEVTALNYLRDKHELDFRQDYEDKDSFMECEFRFKSGYKYIISASTDCQFNKTFTMPKTKYHGKEVYPAESFGEVKNMADSNFNKLRPKRGMIGEERVLFQFPKYYYQVQVYLMIHHKLGLPWEKACFIVRNKKTGELMVYPIFANQKVWKEIKQKGLDVAKHYKEGTVPDCTCDYKSKKWCRWTNSCAAIDVKKLKEEGMSKDFDPNQFELDPSYIFNAAGTSFRAEAMKELIDRKPSFSDLKGFLEHDPDNKYDPNAIKVMIKHTRIVKVDGLKPKKRYKTFHVGFVPKKYTQHVSELMEDSNYFIELYKAGFKDDKPYATILIRRSK